MSRSTKGKKGPGFDYWSRRHGNDSKCQCPGKGVKKATNRAERRITNTELLELAKRLPPPQSWYDSDEEQLFDLT